MIDLLFELLELPQIEWRDDGWFGRDKVGHFILHFSIGFFYTKVLRCAPGGIIFSESFGFAWEMYDSARGVGASRKDLIYNNLGMITGTVLGMV